MSGLPILDLVVGIIFIYFLLSIICSSIVELLFTVSRARAKLLEAWLKKIFDLPALDSEGNPSTNGDGGKIILGQAIMDHCMTTALSGKGKSTSYINAENFVSALLDKITITPAKDRTTQTQLPPTDLAGYATAISNSPVISGELKRTILLYANEAKEAYNVIKTIPGAASVPDAIKSELDHFRERLEAWFNTNAQRLSGTLKRKKVFPATIVLATTITVLLNADSIKICRYLFDHKEKAKEFADKALSSLDSYNVRIESMKAVRDTSTPITIAKLDSSISYVKRDIENMRTAIPTDLPLGWKAEVSEPFEWSDVVGWLMTVFAICLGAPFWFDILNKIANLRGTGPKPAALDDSRK